MSWELRSLQGTVYGSITVVMLWYSPGQVIQLSTLDREQGWIHQHVSVPDLVVDSGDAAVFRFSWEWATKQGLAFRGATHGACALVLGQDFCFLLQVPSKAPALWEQYCVLELSDLLMLLGFLHSLACAACEGG